MIAKHSAEQSRDGEGVEVMENRPHRDEEHGSGQFTEKRIHIHGWVGLNTPGKPFFFLFIYVYLFGKFIVIRKKKYLGIFFLIEVLPNLHLFPKEIDIIAAIKK